MTVVPGSRSVAVFYTKKQKPIVKTAHAIDSVQNILVESASFELGDSPPHNSSRQAALPRSIDCDALKHAEKRREYVQKRPNF